MLDDLRAIAKRGEQDEAWDQLPTLPDALMKYWNSWKQLRRRVGPKETCVPFAEIKAWLELNHINDSDERDLYVHFVTGLDEHMAEEAVG